MIYNFDSLRAMADRHSVDFTQIAPLPATPQVDRDLAAMSNADLETQGSVLYSDKDTGRHFYGNCGSQGLPVARTSANFFRSIPKAELHLHRGVMSDILSTSEIAWSLSAKTDQGLQKKYSSVTELVSSYLDAKYGTLASYLDRYNELASYINKDLDAIRAVVFAGAMRAFENGVRLLEIRTSIKTGQFGDALYRSEMKGVQISPKEEMQAIVDGLLMAENFSGGKLKCFIGVIFRRSAPLEELSPSLDQVIDLSNYFAERMGYRIINHVDIGGAEKDLNKEQEIISKAKKFAPIFRKARAHGLMVTAHAGEGQGAGEGSIWHALNAGAQRIGHGTSLYLPWSMIPEDLRWTNPETKLQKNSFIMALMMGVPFEMCLSSNLACAAEITTGYTRDRKTGKPDPVRGSFKSYDDYPALLMMALGGLHYNNRSRIMPLPCTDGIHTLNTDLAREYALTSATFEMGVDVMLGISRYSFRHAFAPPEVRAWAIREWREEASKYLNDPRFSSPDEQAKAALEKYCSQVRSKLGISDEILEDIRREVHSPSKYLPPELLTIFRGYKRYPDLTK